ncbi:ATP-binding cassette domain-containing protein [Marinomonas sp. GJ51-6]|uniref:ATP-binding cassette domain-containing protein n=1 Tax=Marinomonas sp. GJ51-6 TaxID=2992802 RepID=UPI002934E326|nr:ATP-binding cassette domain-containing protein [Marinomonas sp. GJ51-6]WOD08910.1 ATP-binding cassette domain-containing protein [Marinomonas sp. GJ51-6]
MLDNSSSTILAVKNLSVEFDPSRVIDDLSFSVHQGKTLAIVGESGSGKSITSQSIMRLAETSGAQYPSGQILFSTEEGETDLLSLSQDEMRRIRGKDIAMIFQESHDIAQSCFYDWRSTV